MTLRTDRRDIAALLRGVPHFPRPEPKVYTGPRAHIRLEDVTRVLETHMAQGLAHGFFAEDPLLGYLKRRG